VSDRGHEGERDRAVDGGEDGDSARPEAFEQAAKLIGEGDALGKQVVAAADQGPQRLNLIGGGHQGTEAVPIGAQNVGQHVGIARIAFATSGTVTRAAGFDDIGMDRDHRMAGGEQGSTIRPDGRSIAMGNSAGDVIRLSLAAMSARPAAS
jgi:hypothetical protein